MVRIPRPEGRRVGHLIDARRPAPIINAKLQLAFVISQFPHAAGSNHSRNCELQAIPYTPSGPALDSGGTVYAQANLIPELDHVRCGRSLSTQEPFRTTRSGVGKSRSIS